MFDLPIPDLPNFMFSVFAWLSLAYFFFKTKGYAKKSAEYAADLKYLPKLTQEIEKIKTDFQRSTEIHLGMKGEEREAIFKLSETLTDAVNMCIHPDSCIKDKDDVKEIKQLSSSIDLKLMEFQLLFAKLEILCADRELLKSANNCYYFIVKEMSPLTSKYLLALAHHVTMYRLLTNRDPKAPTLIEEAQAELHKIEQIYRKFNNDIIITYKSFVKIRRSFISSAHRYLSNQFDSNVGASSPTSDSHSAYDNIHSDSIVEGPETPEKLNLEDIPKPQMKESLPVSKDSMNEAENA